MSGRDAIQGKLVTNAAVLDLMDLCLTDRATADQWRTLSELIVEQPEVRDCLAAQAIASARLTLIAQLDETHEDRLVERTGDKKESSSTWTQGISTRFRISRAAMATLAIGVTIILVSCGLLIGFQWMTPSGNQPPILASGPVPPAVKIYGFPGEHAPREFHGGGEEIELPSGKFRAETSAGARLQLTGPLRLRVESPLVWRLFYGKLIANVPSEGFGFTIKTNQAKVVDLGTKFGVAVDKDGDTKVVVYEGHVELTSGRVIRRMLVGDAFIIPTAGEIEPLTFADPSTFLEPGEIPPSVISDVRHNGIDQTATYQIVRGGFQEDALAYTDRVHQWNGVVFPGLSSYLVGLDYVRMANDWKFNADNSLRDDLEITYVFARPAVAYLLVDDRLPKPKWLQDDFADTGWLVGLDKGDHRDSETKLNYQLEQAKGPGASVDVVLRVWRIVLPQGGELKIGPLGSRADDWVVPCLVARPI
ncbi:FecR family protein [Blastopirellula sp. J2-11]|uniref:FecR family protein n=1 Tax=Blastopirellula sp. J2-11 TaxID=2943192 RepID=UPI0021CA1874|nr:FecR family protein [Blastopirellula sp. J2-11]UUO08742.1 FecR family protein [Blastopirellula sp. J2-11]